MTSALTGLVLLLAIVVLTVALGALTRLLAAWIAAPRGSARGPRGSVPATALERIAVGSALIARDLRPDSTHPVARTAEPGARPDRAAEEAAQRELARRYFFAATHRLS